MAIRAVPIKNTAENGVVVLLLGTEVVPNEHGILVDPFVALLAEQGSNLRGTVQEQSPRNSVDPHFSSVI